MTEEMCSSKIQEFLRRIARLQLPLERYVFPVLLCLWPLWGTWQGVDVSDAGYSLANYEWLSEGMWYYATFLANKAGRLLMLLPGGSGLFAMNVKCAFLVSMAALATYYNLQRLMPGWMVFVGEMLAISVFWCPTVILYNTLSYVFLTFACICLFRAESGIPRIRGWYAAAGVFLGLNVFVRFSNLLQAVLILAVWLEEVWSRRSLKKAASDTGYCIAGYVAGAAAGYLWTATEGGFGAWPAAIAELFGIGGDYTFGEMLRTTLDAYGTAIWWMLIMAACVIAGMFFYAMPILRQHRYWKHLIYLAGVAALLRLYWGRGAFTTNYQDYWCMFNLVMMFLILTIFLDVVGLAGGFGATTDERFLSALSLLLILLLPFGSNNYTFPILLDLFVIAPFSLWMFRRIWQEFRRRTVHFPLQCMAMVLIAAVLVQGGLFHMNYSFRDGTDGTKRTALVQEVPAAKGMHTTPQNAKELEGMYAYLEGNGLTERTLLTYGDIPGLSYLFQMEPALSTAWPDLASYQEALFEKEVTELSGAALAGHSDTLPVVIIRHDADHSYSEKELKDLSLRMVKWDRITAENDEVWQEGSFAAEPETAEEANASGLLDDRIGTQEERKAASLEIYLEEAGYQTCYESEHYMVKIPVRR